MDLLALDIGTVNIKGVRLLKKGNLYVLDAAGVVPTPEGATFRDDPDSIQILGNAIKQLRADARIKTNKVVASLPEADVFSRAVSLPKMSMKELETAIRWEAEQYIPLPLSEVNYSYTVVGNNEQGGIEVLIVAAPLRLIDRYQKILAAADLEPVAIETELLSVSRSVIDNSNQTIMIIDIGARTSDMAITRNGQLIFTRSTPTGGAALTKAIMSNLQIEESQAESFKRSDGLKTEQHEGRVAVAMNHAIDAIITEVNRTINYLSRRENINIDKIILTGGTAMLPGISEYFGQQLNHPVETGDPLLHIDKDERLTSLQDIPLYSIAIGLAMKEL